MSYSMIDPQIKPILKEMAAAMKNTPAPGSRPPEQVQENFAAGQKYWNEDPPNLPAVEDEFIPGPFGPIPVRHYQPVLNTEKKPVLVFFHGGGWIAGNLDTHDYLARALAKESSIDIISVEYGLAPERHFPETIAECTAAVKWIRQNASSWRLDPDRIAVGGDSAGGNLSLAVALSLRDAGETWLKFCMLFYAALNPELTSESHRLFGGIKYGSTPDLYKWFWDSYLPQDKMKQDPLAVPLLSDMKGLPPMFVGIAACDAIRDDSLQLCRILEAAEVPYESHVYPGTIHGFLQFLRTVNIAKIAVKDAAAALKKGL
ncbi:MAG: alpha/beta hydrolase [Spirochaetales bacterium]|nr:alpha/beta hydrolase [Spirochaetales bacterium]